MTMDREYIEREAAKERLRIWITDCLLEGDNDTADCFRDCIDLLDSIPAADVAPVRHGRWEAWMPDKNGETREFICTGCRFMVEMSWKQKECDYEWCPYCGCKMDKEETNERI